jgi:hydroxymethylglutaryl-CoA lyase
VVEQLGRIDGVTRIGLVLNERGAQRAMASGLEQIGAVASASDAFGIRNQGQDSAASVAVAEAIVRSARAAGRTAQVTIAMAFGCPFEGAVDPRRVVEMAARLAEAGPVEIGLADTIGVAVPAQVSALVQYVATAIAPLPVRGHFHNTRGTGIANVWAAIGAGARVIDTAVGGLGGCPFAPGAAGNVATEDVAYLLAQSGIPTGLDLEQLVQTALWLEQVMGKPMPSMLSKPGVLKASGNAA